MSLPIRIEYEGAMYHVMSHGNGFQWIYKSRDNLLDFINLLDEVIQKYKFKINCFVLMRNHYHMLIETPEANLSLGMKKLNRDFARVINNNLKRKGSVFRHRYKAILIEKEQYYLNVLRYIYQNPVKIRKIEKAEDYEGSSLYYLVRNKDVDIRKILYLKTQKEYIGKEDFIKKLVAWINAEEEPDPMKNTGYKYLLGQKKWVQETREKYVEQQMREEYTDSRKLYQMEIDERKLKKLTEGKKKGKDIRIYIYSKYTGLTQQEIREKEEIKRANTAGQRLKRFKKLIAENERIAKEVNEIEEQLFIGKK